LAADAEAVLLLEVHADCPGPDEDAVDSDIDDLLEPPRAVLGRARDRELVDQLVGARLQRVELDLAGSAAAASLDAAARRAVDRLHRLHRLLVSCVLGLVD